jgi:hypothetical protein
MHELAGWENISVKQKDLVWGCIPAGYEWMIRFAQVKIIKLDCFQENCLLDVIKAEKSLDFNFKTIAEAIIKRNPNLDIQIYMNGKEHVDTNFRSVNHAKKSSIPL